MSGLSTPSRRLSSTTTCVSATQSAESLLMEFGPGARAGMEAQQPDALAAEAERQHEQPRAPVLAGARIADHRAGAVIDLRLLRLVRLMMTAQLPAIALPRSLRTKRLTLS